MYTIRHFSISILVVLLVFSIAFIGCQKKGTDEIVLGAIMPLTGDAAVYGKNCKQGIELAVDEINAKGGINGKKLKVLFEDDQLQPKMAVSLFTKLVTVDKVLAVIGPLPSSCAMATAPLANQYKVVSFSPGASTPKLTGAGPYVFRNWQSDALEAAVMAEYALKQGWKTFSILYVNNDFGVSLEDYFKKKVESLGGKVLSSESFEQGVTDFKPQISKIKKAKAQVVYLLSYPQQTPMIVNQMRELGVKCQILGVAAFEDPSLLKIASRNADGIIFTKALPLLNTDSIRAAFISAYKKQFGEEPGLIADNGFDAVKTIVLAISNSIDLKPECIQMALKEIKEFRGASGFMTFDENGDVIRPIGLEVVKKSSFEWLSK